MGTGIDTDTKLQVLAGQPLHGSCIGASGKALPYRLRGYRSNESRPSTEAQARVRALQLANRRLITRQA